MKRFFLTYTIICVALSMILALCGIEPDVSAPWVLGGVLVIFGLIYGYYLFVPRGRKIVRRDNIETKRWQRFKDEHFKSWEHRNRKYNEYCERQEKWLDEMYMRSTGYCGSPGDPNLYSFPFLST